MCVWANSRCRKLFVAVSSRCRKLFVQSNQLRSKVQMTQFVPWLGLHVSCPGKSIYVESVYVESIRRIYTSNLYVESIFELF